MVYTLVTVTVPPPAVVPVAVTVMLDVPASRGVPLSHTGCRIKSQPSTAQTCS